MNTEELPFVLDFIKQVIDADQAPSGLAGSVAVGVRLPNDAIWLRVDLDRRARTKVCAATTAKARILLTEDGAAALIAGKPLGEGAAVVDGAMALLEQFVSRYLTKRTVLALRSGARS